MPHKLKHACRYPRCPELTDDNSGYCPKHKKHLQRKQDQERGSSYARGYGRQWQRASKAYLAKHPLCVLCAKKEPPLVRAASLVDHKKPHRGDPALFWDENNWQSLCKECHDIKTAKEDGAFGNKTKKAG